MTKIKRNNATKYSNNTAQNFKDCENDQQVLRSQFLFLQRIWNFEKDKSEPVYNFVGFKEVTTGKWVEHAVVASEGFYKVSRLLRKYSRYDYDQYFCPNPFSKPRRKRQFALPTRFCWCDIDNGDPETFRPRPTMLCETSPSRYQGLWELNQTIEADRAEKCSKALAYNHGGDKNGWSATKMLRLIGSINHKPDYDEPLVQSLPCDRANIVSPPHALSGFKRQTSIEFNKVDVTPNKHKSADVLRKYHSNLHPKVRYLIRNRTVKEPNRSAQVFHMIAGLHEAGASHDEIACVVWESPYFVEKHGKNIRKLNEEIARVISKLESKS